METVLPVWQTIQQRFYKLVSGIPQSDLELGLDSVTIVSLIRHTAEAEFIFMEWFFGQPTPEHVKERMSRKQSEVSESVESVEQLLELLQLSNENIMSAMRNLPEDAWHKPVESPMGASTPLEAIGRLMYHAGIHAGQISLIQKVERSNQK
ncbi:DinB family protein [Paenibacillus yanchengensis]|uniref:DinB family protein n=1 Tax=Paenibacillus yanchengensis TaxID=2035833 RepID=A0ABW4YJ64_9BACL